jgi:hypothetical protein
MTDPIDPCNDPTPPIPCVVTRGDITDNDVKCAQQEWCAGLLEISRKYWATPREDFRGYAKEFIKKLYDFNGAGGGRVFFRPTLAEFPENFRTTFDGTLEYFVGKEGNEDDRSDGFAKKKLVGAKYSNRVDTEDPAIQRYGRIGVAMGNVCLKETVIIDEREVTKDIVVDKTFVYRKDDQGNVKLILHMSAQRNAPGEKAIE